jgi:hypothetical protein
MDEGGILEMKTVYLFFSLIMLLFLSCAISHQGKYGTVTVTLSLQDIDNLVKLSRARGIQDTYQTQDGKTIIRIK